MILEILTSPFLNGGFLIWELKILTTLGMNQSEFTDTQFPVKYFKVLHHTYNIIAF